MAIFVNMQDSDSDNSEFECYGFVDANEGIDDYIASEESDCKEQRPTSPKQPPKTSQKHANPAIPRSFARLTQQPITPVVYKPVTYPMHLNTPCPKCKKADCFWHCSYCLSRFCYDNRRVYCTCSSGLLQEYQFRCMDTTHGEEYVPFEQIKVMAVQEKLLSIKTVNIVLLGLTGTGKSTLINSLANYIKYETFEEAQNSKLMYCVPVAFTHINFDFEKLDVKIGKKLETEIPNEKDRRADSENFDKGESATRCPKVHMFRYNNLTINIIDTPGLCTTVGNDEENFRQTLQYINSFEKLHGICIVLKSCESRKLITLKHCIQQLLLHLHRNAIDNLMFCFTHTSGSRPQDSITTLDEILKDINRENGADIKLSSKNTFSVDNEAFRYLCTQHRGFQYGDGEDKDRCLKSWNKSRDAVFSLIDRALINTPHLTNETIALNTIRSIIIGLNKPLAKITELIQKNKTTMESKNTELGQLTGTEEDLSSRLKLPILYIKKRELTCWRVVCGICAEAKRDHQGEEYRVTKVCCDGCRAPFLYFCASFNFRGVCRVCKCPKSSHEHVNYEYIEFTSTIEDQEVKDELESVGSQIENINLAIKTAEYVIKELDAEQRLVSHCAAKFANYIKHNAIVLHNRSYEEYLGLMIKNAESAAQSTGNYSTVQNLKNALAEYLDDMHFLEEQFKKLDTSDSPSCQLSVKDVIKARDTLFKMKWNGSTMRDIFDRELTHPMFQHTSVVKQQLIVQQEKRKSRGMMHKANKVLNNIVSHLADPSTIQFGSLVPRIDDFGRALQKNPTKDYSLS